MRKLLTIYDLEQFYSKYKKNMKFNAKDAGYQIAVQIPSVFESAEDSDDETIEFYNVKCFHTNRNRNSSSVTEDAAIKAMKTMAYKPVLANFCEYTDEDGNTIRDFTSHDIEIDDDGEVKYLERQIGCLTNDEPWFIEEDDGRKFVCSKVAIPNDYTDANSIIERKGGTKMSVELIVNSMEYDCKEKLLELTDVTVQGITCLGTRLDANGKPHAVEEGMQGAKISLSDFSTERNSVFSHINEDTNIKLIETLEKLNDTISMFSINNNKSEGVSDMDKFNELLKKYGVTAEDCDFDYENMTDEELEIMFEEVFKCESDNENGDDSVDEKTDVADEEEENEESDESVDENDDEANDESSEDFKCKKRKKCSIDEDGDMVISFSVSHEEIRFGLYQLLEQYNSLDNEWYFITNVYDDYFVFENWDGNKYYRQGYSVDKDAVSFSGERIELFKEMLTASEKAALDEMRSNYAALVKFKADTEFAALQAKKDAIFARPEYANVAETKSFKKLISESKDYSIEECESKANDILDDFKSYAANFASNEDSSQKKPKTIGLQFEKDDEKKDAYNGLFADYKKKYGKK